MFVSGALRLQRSGLMALDFFDRVDETYGAEDGTLEQSDYTVYVPPNSFELSEHDMSELQVQVNPMAESSDFGIDLYLSTIEFLLDLN